MLVVGNLPVTTTILPANEVRCSSLIKNSVIFTKFNMQFKTVLQFDERFELGLRVRFNKRID